MYNWWSLFVRLANPNKHYEAITSRPLLLSSVGRLTQGGRQKRITITSSHGQAARVQVIYRRLAAFFNELKAAAPQLTPQMCWERILAKAMEAFPTTAQAKQTNLLPMPT